MLKLFHPSIQNVQKNHCERCDVLWLINYIRLTKVVSYLVKRTSRGDITLKLQEKKFENILETERLVIRPLTKDDYENWLNGFENRYPSQNRYDQGKIDMSECTLEWFYQLVEKHQELALADNTYIFGVFRKSDGTHLGMIDFSTLARDDFQWGRVGYTIHNQY